VPRRGPALATPTRSGPRAARLSVSELEGRGAASEGEGVAGGERGTGDERRRLRRCCRV